MGRVVGLLGRLARDRRGSAYQILMALIFLGAVALSLSVLLEPTQQVRDFGEERTAGTEYESYGDTTRERTWQAFAALPMFAVALALVFVVVMALVLSSRR
jgi:hypothetical protein